MSICSATQSGIGSRRPRPAVVTLEGRAHLHDVPVHRAGGDGLLEAAVVVGLRQVDPLDGGAGVVLPRLQEAAEEVVVQVLVVEAQELEVDARALTLGDVRLGGAQGHLADLLPLGVRGLAHAHAGDGQDLSAQSGFLRRDRLCILRVGRQDADQQCRRCADGCRPRQQPPPGTPRSHHRLVELDLHDRSSSVAETLTHPSQIAG